MTLKLVTAPAGAGKTEYVLEQIRAHTALNPLARVLILLPSSGHSIALRERMHSARTAQLGVTLTEFSKLYREILDASGQAVRVLSDTARYRLLRVLLREHVAQNKLEYFAPIADKPGLIDAFARFMTDVKRARISHEKFADLANTARLRDLAKIYAAYQTFLQDRALADDEGIGWLALAALAQDDTLFNAYAYIAADGFDEFDPTQAELLKLLAARNAHTDLTLTFENGRAAHTRFARVVEQFSGAAREALAPRVPPRTDALEHLERNLFEANAVRIARDDSIELTAAADRLRETQHIARTVKQLLLDGARAADIAVLFRSLEIYQPLVREVFNAYGIPYRIRGGMALTSNALIAEILNLIALSVNDFPRRETMDALRSSYFLWRDLDAHALAQIDTITREAVVVRGRDAFLDAFIKPQEKLAEQEHDRRLVAQLDAFVIETLRARLENFFARVTPPQTASVSDFVSWLERLLGPDPVTEAYERDKHPETFAAETESLRVIERVRAGDAETAARDLAALAAFKRVLGGLVQASQVLNESACAWNEFFDDLRDALASTTYDLAPAFDGRVLVAGVTMVRGIPRKIIFLGGLVEGEFPARAPENVLLTEQDRRTLEDAGLTRAGFHTSDEKTYFYQAVTLAREKLYLTYATLDEAARQLNPSPYVSDVRALFENLHAEKIGLNAVPEFRQAASLNELAIALARAQTRGQNETRALEQALLSAFPAWQHSLHARAMELRRESNAPHDEYSGILRADDLRAEMQKRFDARYPWSASQFNEWGACGFRFFAGRLLKLEETQEPEEGLDILQRGALYHAILEQTYKKFAAQNFAVTPETLEQARAILDETANEVLENAPAHFGFRPTAWWAQERAEVTRILRALLDAEAERNGSHAPIPYALEQKFDVQLNLGETTLRVRGVLDRIDQRDDGLVLVDYKSGATKIPKREVYDGRNLQLPVYVMALRAQGQNVADAFFVHITNGETSGMVDENEREAWLASARKHMNTFLNNARDGNFPVKPTQYQDGACNRHCDFAALCRVGRWSNSK